MPNLTPYIISIQAWKVHSQQVTVNNVVEQNNYVTVFGLPCEKSKTVLPPLSFPYPSTQMSKAGTIRYANGKLLMYENQLNQDRGRPGDICERLWKARKCDWEWVQYSMGKDTVSLPLECWDIMKLSAKWQLTTVLCVLVCSRWKGGGMLSMCNHIYWLFGDNLLKTLCERHSLAWAVCYGKVTPWPFGFGPEERKVPFDLGSRFSVGKHGILTISFVELFCCISLSRPVQCTDKQVPGY